MTLGHRKKRGDQRKLDSDGLELHGAEDVLERGWVVRVWLLCSLVSLLGAEVIGKTRVWPADLRDVWESPGSVYVCCGKQRNRVR